MQNNEVQITRLQLHDDDSRCHSWTWHPPAHEQPCRKAIWHVYNSKLDSTTLDSTIDSTIDSTERIDSIKYIESKSQHNISRSRDQVHVDRCPRC